MISDVNCFSSFKLSAPRPPSGTVTQSDADAFFFTTTTASTPVNVAVDSSTPTPTLEPTKASSLFDFDMRKFFFIPNRNEVSSKPTTNSDRRVLTGFFNG